MQTAKLGKYEVAFDDSVEFHTLRREIWGAHCYYLDQELEAPHILDIGSHIGLSILYFKQLFPDSTIDAYEPHPQSLALLRQNLDWNNLSGVNVHPLAVSTGEPELILHQNQDNSWRSTISIFPGAWNESQQTTPYPYPAIPLKAILTTHYDLAKLDVEGYEYELLMSSRDALTNVDHWLVEIHGRGHYDIRALVALFEDRGYRVRLDKGGKTIKPHQLTGLALLHADYAGAK